MTPLRIFLSKLGNDGPVELQTSEVGGAKARFPYFKIGDLVRDDLGELLTRKRVGVYVGVDPTARSLHVGHLLPLMALYWLWYLGYPTTTLVGGATAKIGDPSGRTSAREVRGQMEYHQNTVAISHKLEQMWTQADNDIEEYGFERDAFRRRRQINNERWLDKISIVDFLGALGTGVRVGPMLGRDTVKTRLQGGNGMTIAEFLYPLVQAWDWWHMYSTLNVQVQIGGADQFGNILAGMDAVNFMRKKKREPITESSCEPDEINDPLAGPLGFTIPLLTTATGEKFGKSAGNAVWLDRNMTSAFNLYRFFMSTSDEDVHRYLKLFTFDSLETLEHLMAQHDQNVSARIAQHRLAYSVVRIVHGTREADKTRNEHKLLYQNRWGFSSETVNFLADYRILEQAASDVKEHVIITLPKSLIEGQPMTTVLYSAGLADSLANARRLLSSKGVYVGIKRKPLIDDKVHLSSDFDATDAGRYLIMNRLLFLRTGKSNIKVIKIIPDEDFKAQGFDAPGWSDLRDHS